MSIKTKLAEYHIQSQDGQIEIFLRSAKSKTSQMLPLFSERNIGRDIQRRLGNFKPITGFIALVNGLAQLPLILELLKSQSSNEINIVVFEADVTLAENIIAKHKQILTEVLIVTPQNIEHINRFCEQIVIEKFLGYRIFQHQLIESLNKNFYLDCGDLFKSNMSSKISDLFTRMEFEPVWITNCLTNILKINQVKPVKELFGHYQGFRVMLVSTGPSLRESLPYIKKNQGKVYVACVDSAYRVLQRYGVQVDFIFSLDSQPFTARHFSLLPLGDLSKKEPVLIADLVANPSVVNNWQGSCYYSITAQFLNKRREVTPGCDYIESQLMPYFLGETKGIDEKNKKYFTFGDIQSGGSVATSLFDLLRQMGFDKILLVGQDLAYSNREIHTSGTHHSDLWLSKNSNRFNSIENINFAVVKKRHTREVISIKGKPIVEDYILSLYASWFSSAANLVKDQVINCTTNGIKIENIKYSTLEREMCDLTIEIDKVFYGKNFNISEEKINSFRETLLEQTYSDSLNEKFEFINRIGRKFKIMYNRKTQSSSGDYPPEVIQKVELVRNLFWKKLQKNLKRYEK